MSYDIHLSSLYSFFFLNSASTSPVSLAVNIWVQSVILPLALPRFLLTLHLPALTCTFLDERVQPTQKYLFLRVKDILFRGKTCWRKEAFIGYGECAIELNYPNFGSRDEEILIEPFSLAFFTAPRYRKDESTIEGRVLRFSCGDISINLRRSAIDLLRRMIQIVKAEGKEVEEMQVNDSEMLPYTRYIIENCTMMPIYFGEADMKEVRILPPQKKIPFAWRGQNNSGVSEFDFVFFLAHFSI